MLSRPGSWSFRGLLKASGLIYVMFMGSVIKEWVRRILRVSWLPTD